MNRYGQTTPPPRRPRARAIAATRRDRTRDLVHAALVGTALLLGAALFTAGQAQAGDPGAALSAGHAATG